MEITQQDCGFRTGDDEDDEHQAEETKHVVGLVGPVTQQSDVINIEYNTQNIMEA